MIKTSYDLVIIGGGPAGFAAAITILKKLNLNVLVIDALPEERERIGESCPPDTLLLLKQLDVLKEFHQGNHQPCPGFASVWGKTQPGYNDFIVNPLGPAWRLNRQQFDGMLAAKAESLGATIQWNTRFINLIGTEKNTHTLVLYQNNQKYQVNCKFVIDASGAKARFATALGINKIIDDQLFALVRFVDHYEGAITKQVCIEAEAKGWWYNATLPNNRLVSMLVTDQANINNLQKNDYKTFDQLLHQTTFIGEKLNTLELHQKTYHTWPIFSGRLPVVEGFNWMAIGDAASSYDPIAAQGIYKALNDGIMASEKVVAYFNNTPTTLEYSSYIKERYQNYLKNKQYLYGMEQRWKNHPFWKERTASSIVF